MKFKFKHDYNTILVLIFIIYITAYIVWIYPLRKLHTIQTKQWIAKSHETLILGIKDESKLASLGYAKQNQITFFFTYFQVQTSQYTIVILLNLKNKFSDDMDISIYMHDYIRNVSYDRMQSGKFSELNTYNDNGILGIRFKDFYDLRLDMAKNKCDLVVKTPSINIDFNMDITDFTTTQPMFLPRYQLLHKLTGGLGGNETFTPGEWANDHNFIGTLANGTLNGSLLDQGGRVWFDYCPGINNMWLHPYMWFIIHNDDWLVYQFFWGAEGNLDCTRMFYIKDIKNDKMLYAGMDGDFVSFPFKWLNDIIQPLEMSYSTKSKLGNISYDNYETNIQSNNFKYKCKSIAGKSHRMKLYDYYKTNDIDYNAMNDWDQKYYKTISNTRFVEYANIVDITIEYNGKIEQFKARQIVEGMYPVDPSIPTKILYTK